MKKGRREKKQGGKGRAENHRKGKGKEKNIRSLGSSIGSAQCFDLFFFGIFDQFYIKIAKISNFFESIFQKLVEI